MKKILQKKAALYDPYLDTLGGGEKHILSILKALEDENFEISIFWNKNLNQEIKKTLDIEFNNTPNYLPNIFNHQMSSRAKPSDSEDERGDPSKVKLSLMGLLRRFTSRNDIFYKLSALHQFDLFFYISDGSYFFSSAKKNFVFCMVPNQNLYKMGLLNKLKTLNYRFITNSNFTNTWLNKFGIKGKVIYPYLQNDFINIPIESIKKDKIILSVGRFFRQLHAKRHDVMINLFKKVKQNHTLFKDFKLILCGGLKDEDNEYFNELKKLIGDDDSIILKPNISYLELFDLYKKSLVFWHFTGYDVNEELNPQAVEHLGITPLEAMASGCITFCYKAGGPKEIIENGKTGYLFESENDLINKTRLALSSRQLQEEIQRQAKKFVIENFSYEVFRKRVEEVILE